MSNPPPPTQEYPGSQPQVKMSNPPPPTQEYPGPQPQAPPPPYSTVAGEKQGDPAYPAPPGDPAYPAQGGANYPPQAQPAAYQPPPNQYPQQPGYTVQPGYPAPGAGGGQQQQHTVVVTQQPTMVTTMVQPFRDMPVTCQCPVCHQQVTTALSYESGTLAWLACLGLFFIGCNLGCCLIPFCINECKDVHHFCPNCHSRIGSYSRI